MNTKNKLWNDFLEMVEQLALKYSFPKIFLI